jgi:hypothetical protein
VRGTLKLAHYYLPNSDYEQFIVKRKYIEEQSNGNEAFILELGREYFTENAFIINVGIDFYQHVKVRSKIRTIYVKASDVEEPDIGCNGAGPVPC